MVRLILQDIDNVLYPFKEKHTEYLLNSNLISEDLAEKFLKSKKAYLIDYILYQHKIGNCINVLTKNITEKYKEQISMIKELYKEKKLTNKDLKDYEIELRAIFFATFEGFFASKYFVEGIINELVSLNNEIKNNNSDIEIFGITARATYAKKEAIDVFKVLANTTNVWNVNNGVGLDKIFFEHDKIRALEDIKNLEGYEDSEIICFVEDDPRNLRDFLERKIKCVLILFEHHESEELIKELKENHPNDLFLANNHEEAREMILSLVNLSKKNK